MITCYCNKCNLDFKPDGGQLGIDSTCPFCNERTEMHSQLYWCDECNVPIFDEVCPECGTKLVKAEGETAWYCPNTLGCPPQIKGRIEHFISRKAMNINAIANNG